MKKEGKDSLAAPVNDEKIFAVNQLLKALEKQIEKFEAAYIEKDPREFNSLKKDILQLQRKINDLAE